MREAVIMGGGGVRPSAFPGTLPWLFGFLCKRGRLLSTSLCFTPGASAGAHREGTWASGAGFEGGDIHVGSCQNDLA